VEFTVSAIKEMSFPSGYKVKINATLQPNITDVPPVTVVGEKLASDPNPTKIKLTFTFMTEKVVFSDVTVPSNKEIECHIIRYIDANGIGHLGVSIP